MRRTLAVLVPIVGVAIALAVLRATSPDAGPLPRGTLHIATGRDEVRLSVEIAETAQARARGLMGRDGLAPDAGMVFLFDRPTTGGFWMKDTVIPLSIAFWGPDGRVVAILDMEPCRADPCPVYWPGVSYVGAVEVNRGFFDRHGVSPGDRVELIR